MCDFVKKSLKLCKEHDMGTFPKANGQKEMKRNDLL